MSSNTTNLKLYKADPVADKDNTFNIKTMLNDNWDKIDTEVANIKSGTTKVGASTNADTATKLKAARSIALTGDVTGSASFDGFADVSITATVGDDSHNHSNYVPFATKSATTPATAGWYRIAQSAVNIGANSALFKIDFSGTGVKGSALLRASCHDGVDSGSGINQLGFTTTNAILGLTQIRIVYNTTASGNYAYVEIYNPTALAITYTVDLIDSTGWTLVMPNTTGSVPAGYTSKTLICDTGFVSAEDVTATRQLRSNIATGTAPLVVTSTTRVANLNVDMVDDKHVDDTKTDASSLWTANKISSELSKKLNTTDTLDKIPSPSADYSMNNKKITNLADPVNNQDAATKNYVDAARAGLSIKDPVRVATTANITLSGTQTIDGIAVAIGDRVLVKNQTTASQNGIYIVASGAWTRSPDANVSSEVVPGMYAWVNEGTTNGDSRWVLTTNAPITLDTTALTFTKDFQGSDLVANNGITKSGNTIGLTGGIATPGTYPKVTVDTYGRVTGGSNLVASDIPNLDWSKISGKPNSLSGYGITDAIPSVKLGQPGGPAKQDDFAKHLNDEVTPEYDTPVTMTNEVTRLNCLNKNLVNLVITGKTIVNLLGSDGDCEDTSKWKTSGTTPAVTATLDGLNKVFGNNGIKVTNIATNGIMYKEYNLLDGFISKTKYYCLSAYLKNGNATNIALSMSDYSAYGQSSTVTDTTKFNRIFIKYDGSKIAADARTVRIDIIVNGVKDSYGYVDGIMLEEITAGQYNDPNFAPSPYVNSDMSVGDVITRVKSRGKNIGEGYIKIAYANVTSGYKPSYELNTVRSLVRVPVKSNTTYTFSANIANRNGIIFEDLNLNFIATIEQNFSVFNNPVWTFTTPTDCKYVTIYYAKLDDTANAITEPINVQLEEGTTPTPYTPYEETYANIQYPLRSLPSGIKDEIKDGKLIQRIQKLVLDGSLSWSVVYTNTGYKGVTIAKPLNAISGNNNSAIVLKYNNKKLYYQLMASDPDSCYIDTNYLWISIANSDSGWGDSYTPTPDEIKAQRLGWVMYRNESGPSTPYNGIGTKAWCYRLGNFDGTPNAGNMAGRTTTLPTTLAPGFTPDRLYYQLATPIITEINMPNIVAFPNGDLIMESDSQSWIRPSVEYTICKNSRANLDEVMKGLSDITRTAQNLPYIRSFLTASQIIPSGVTTLLSGTPLTVQKSGTYLVVATATWGDLNGIFTATRQVSTYINSSLYDYDKLSVPDSWVEQVVTKLYYLSAGTTVDIRVLQCSGNSQNIAGATLRLVRIGD